MKNQKYYEPDDKMIDIIRDNYNILQSLGAFGISLGFGDKTVREVCENQHVDTYTFLAVINFTINGVSVNPEQRADSLDKPYQSPNDHSMLHALSIPTLMKYLRASHAYYVGFQLPRIRQGLLASLNPDDNLARLIIKLFDEYAHAVEHHARMEEKTLFPYVEELLQGKETSAYNIDIFSKHHHQTTGKLRELKNIITKYLPSDRQHNHQLATTLFDIYNTEQWLTGHVKTEEELLIPVIKQYIKQQQQDSVSAKISNMLSPAPDSQNALSDREKDVVISLVQGMSNKEIAQHLCISTNTVITHRRNIARKLQIHSPAGLTIYAIVNKLVDISQI